MTIAAVRHYTPGEIKAVRERLGYSQAVFAEAIGVTLHAVRQWEQGRREPEAIAQRMIAIADTEPEQIRRFVKTKGSGRD